MNYWLKARKNKLVFHYASLLVSDEKLIVTQFDNGCWGGCLKHPPLPSTIVGTITGFTKDKVYRQSKFVDWEGQFCMSDGGSLGTIHYESGTVSLPYLMEVDVILSYEMGRWPL